MTGKGTLLMTLLVLATPGMAFSQQRGSSWTPELSISGGVGHVFRLQDQSFGGRGNIGGSMAIAHRSGFVIELEADRIFGLEPQLTPCGIAGVTCIGTGFDGPRTTTVTALNVQCRFTSRRLQPYLTAGIGALWSRSFHSLTHVRGVIAEITTMQSSDRGFGPDVGGGLRIALGRRVAISPEIRWLNAPWLSRENLAATRVMLRATYACR